MITKELLTPIVENKEELESLVQAAYQEYEFPSLNPLVTTKFHKLQMNDLTSFIKEVQKLTKDGYQLLEDRYANRINGSIIFSTFLKPQSTIKSEKAKIRHSVVTEYQESIKEREEQRLIDLKAAIQAQDDAKAQAEADAKATLELYQQALEQINE